MYDDHVSAEDESRGPFLTDVTGLHRDKIIMLPIGTTVLGRNPGVCDVILDGASICSRIARIERTDTATHILDVGCRNGVCVEGERIPTDERRRLRHGEEIGLGPYRFRYTESGRAGEVP